MKLIFMIYGIFTNYLHSSPPLGDTIPQDELLGSSFEKS